MERVLVGCAGLDVHKRNGRGLRSSPRRERGPGSARADVRHDYRQVADTSGLARGARRHARGPGDHRRVLAPRLQSPYRCHAAGPGVRRARRQRPRRRERSPASKEAVANPAITAVILGQARAQRQASGRRRARGPTQHMRRERWGPGRRRGERCRLGDWCRPPHR